ncbi:hypothetical protein EJ04DRAFT_26375 [Polyplosphaeria fusca]|uniref:Uncharacterized protein n=1 Tax=Polyplosphaeria fusca TaxID=682080 RepID=A0A9P4V3R1_9PLEO|nr:hypothetical protein EJ04DRAFT_26375 [Polyplosphaeria fusca]
MISLYDGDACLSFDCEQDRKSYTVSRRFAGAGQAFHSTRAIAWFVARLPGIPSRTCIQIQGNRFYEDQLLSQSSLRGYSALQMVQEHARCLCLRSRAVRRMRCSPADQRMRLGTCLVRILGHLENTDLLGEIRKPNCRKARAVVRLLAIYISSLLEERECAPTTAVGFCLTLAYRAGDGMVEDEDWRVVLQPTGLACA